MAAQDVGVGLDEQQQRVGGVGLEDVEHFDLGLIVAAGSSTTSTLIRLGHVGYLGLFQVQQQFVGGVGLEVVKPLDLGLVGVEEDVIRFVTFLKETDKKAHDAIKHAERETKLKQGKVAEIKRLNQAIQAVQSDISKNRESKDDCLRFKAFLGCLTPKHFFDADAKAKASRQVHRRGERVAHRLEAWAALKVTQGGESEARQAAEHDALLAKGTSKKNAAATVAAMRPPKPPARPPVEAEPLTSSGAELHMYFVAPRQLMDVLTQLEELILFLIQKSQETEQALEELWAESKVA